MCDIYICDEYTDESGNSYCVYYNTKELNMYLNPCDDGFEYPELEEDALSSTCTAPSHSDPD